MLNRLHTLRVIPKSVLLLSVFFLMLSFLFPAYCLETNCNQPSGLYLFLNGWMAIFVNIGALCWLANPVYILALIIILNGKPMAFWFALAAALLALSFSKVHTLIVDEASVHTITELQPGYFLWCASFIVLTIGTGVDWYMEKRKQLMKPSEPQ